LADPRGGDDGRLHSALVRRTLTEILAGAGTLANSIMSLAVGDYISLVGSSLLQPGTMLGSVNVGSRADFEAINRPLRCIGHDP
jgi:hypothetical protein